MYVAHLVLHDFRSYADLDVTLQPGVSTFLGRNGQGKTNLVEAVDYLSRLASHRTGTDTPLVRVGAERAVVRAAVVREGRSATLEVELNPGRANRARVNRSLLPRTRDLAGLVRAVVFSPEDIALVKGDPSERRRFLDDLLVLRSPRLAAVRADYERVLRQRGSLLKSLRSASHAGRRPPRQETAAEEGQGGAIATLGAWDAQLARTGAELLHERLLLVAALTPYAGRAYAALAAGAVHTAARLEYRASVPVPGLSLPDPEAADPEAAGPDVGAARLAELLLAELERRRDEEIERGLCLVGPHRDDLVLSLGTPSGGALPVRGYASHGESWSFALALRLSSYDLLRAEGDDPILILDDVFAELDADRRDRLAALVRDAEQVLVTAAVPADVPDDLDGARFDIADGAVQRAR